MLYRVLGCRHTLDVTHLGESEYADFLGNEVFNVNLAGDVADFRATLIAELLCNFAGLVLDYLHKDGLVGENCLKFFDTGMDGIKFIHDFLNLKACKLSEAEGYDCGSLRLVKLEFFHKGNLGFRLSALAGADCRDDIVDNVYRSGETFKDMCPLLRLLEFKLRSSCNYVLLEVDELLKVFLERQYLRLTVNDTEVDYAE